jgi:hypothetical protein
MLGGKPWNFEPWNCLCCVFGNILDCFIADILPRCCSINQSSNQSINQRFALSSTSRSPFCSPGYACPLSNFRDDPPSILRPFLENKLSTRTVGNNKLKIPTTNLLTMVKEELAEILELRPGRRLFVRHWVY